MSDAAEQTLTDIARALGTNKDDPRLTLVMQRMIDKGMNPAEVAARWGGRSFDKVQVHKVGRTPTGPMRPSDAEDPTPDAPKPDEYLGSPAGVFTRPLVYPPARRNIIRGADKVLTLGLATKAAQKLADKGVPGMEDVSTEQRRSDAIESPNTEGAAELAALLSGKGLGGMVFRGAGTLTGKAAGKVLGNTPSKLAGITAGAGAGGLGAMLGTGGYTLANDLTSGTQPSDALAHAATAAVNPFNLVPGAALGGVSGGASRLARGEGQLARDLRIVEQYAGSPSLTKGAKGGIYDAPLLAGRTGSSRDLGEVSMGASRGVLDDLNRQHKALGDEYTAARKEAGDAGALDAQLDVTPLYQEAQKLMQSRRLTSDTKAKIQREVLDELEPLSDRDGVIRMGVDDFNDFRGKLADLADFNTPTGRVRDDTFAGLQSSARDLLDGSAISDINQAYAKGADRLTEAHRQIGLGNRTHTAPGDVVAQRKLANYLTRRGENTKTAGLEEADAEAFKAQNPALAPLVDAPQLLAAKGRLTAPLLRAPEHGGLFERLHHGALESNLDPLLGTLVYPAGEAIGNVAPRAGAMATTAANLLSAAADRERTANAERARKLREKQEREKGAKKE